MSNFHLIVPLLMAGSMAPAAQDPAPRDVPAVAPPVEIVDVEPQSALRGALLLRGLFEEFARKDGALALGGAFAPVHVIPFSGPTLLVKEMAAVFEAGEPGKKRGVRVGLQLEVRAEGVLAAVSLYERLRAFLSDSDVVVSLEPVRIHEMDDGGGVRVPGFLVVLDASKVEIERWTPGSGTLADPVFLIRACSAMDRIELGPLDIVPSQKVLPSGRAMLSYRTRSARRERSFDVRRLTRFGQALEARSVDHFVTQWRLAPVVDGETGVHGWGVDLTVSRIE